MSKKDAAQEVTQEVAVVIPANTSMVVGGIDMAEFAGAGTLNAQAEDYAIPYLSVLQKLSPAIDTVEGARPGMFFNTVTNQIYKELIVIPVEFRRAIVEWKPREKGGGLVAVHPIDTPLLETAKKLEDKPTLRTPQGTDLVDTRTHFVRCIDPNSGEIFNAVITFTSTQAKKSRKWMNMISNNTVPTSKGRVQAPSFMYQYKFTTVKESNEAGEWFGFVIEPMGRIEDELLVLESLDFYKAINRNEVKVSDTAVYEEETTA